LGGIEKFYPAHFLYAMRLKHLIPACVVLMLVACFASDNAPGFLEGNLRIISFRDVELAEKTPTKPGDGKYVEYPLIILSQDGKKQFARVTADENGKYRVALPAGDYVIDVEGRQPEGHVRAKPKRFTVASSQTVHVDMDIDTGIR
jgi:hypothetical protein